MGIGLSPSHYRNMALDMKYILHGEGELKRNVLAEAKCFFIAVRRGDKSERQTAAFILTGKMHLSRETRAKIETFITFLDALSKRRELYKEELAIIQDLRTFFDGLREIGFEIKLKEVQEYGYWTKRQNRKEFWKEKTGSRSTKA